MDRFPAPRLLAPVRLVVKRCPWRALPDVVPLPTGGLRWHHLFHHRFNSDDDLGRLEQCCARRSRFAQQIEASTAARTRRQPQAWRWNPVADLLERLEGPRLLRLKRRDRTKSVAPDQPRVAQLTDARR